MGKMCYWCMQETMENGVCSRCKRPEYVPDQSNADALPVGTRLDNGSPIIGAILGRGGFGITYVALDNEAVPPRKIALKEYMPRHMATRSGLNLVIDPNHSDEYEHSLRAFSRESSVLNRLREHPNIVNVYFDFTENNTAYYGMEYLEGKSLKEWIRNRGRPLSGKEACVLLNPIMDALAFTHKEGLLHRDVSPSNIFICGGGESDITRLTPKLIDFGAAYAYVGDYTKSIAMIKTKGFTPIEQILYGAECQGSWTDVYAFCAVFYFAITGKNLPDSKDRYIDGEKLPTPNELGAKIPAQAEKALMDGLIVDYKKRTKSMAELQQKLCKAFGIEPYCYTGGNGPTGPGPEPPGPNGDPGDTTQPHDPGGSPPPPPPSGPPKKEPNPEKRARIIGGMLELIICYGAAWLVRSDYTALLYGFAAMALLNTVLCMVGRNGTLGMRLGRLTLKETGGRSPSPAEAAAYSLMTAFFPFSVLDMLVNTGDKTTWREKLLGLTVTAAEQPQQAQQKPVRYGAAKEARLVTEPGGTVYTVYNGTTVHRKGHDSKGKAHTIVLDDETVSGVHCEFYISSGSWVVVDRYSTNHTYVNGTMIEPAREVRLVDGTSVIVGKTHMIFHC